MDPQSLSPERFDSLMQELSVIGKAVGRWEQAELVVSG